MTSHKKSSKKPTLRAEKALALRLTKKHHQEKIKRHADEAWDKKERDEHLRLAIRAKMKFAVTPIVVEATYARNGLRMEMDRMINIIDEQMKELCRILMIEPSSKKKDD